MNGLGRASPSARVVRVGDRRRVPWRNGGGVTEEIVVAPHPADPARFAWRLSVATVGADGPFSPFPGVDRTILLVDGPGMDLRIGDGAWHRLDRASGPFAFPGDAPAEARLVGGPVLDLNVMTDRSACAATVVVHEGPLRLELATGTDERRVVVPLDAPAEATIDGAVTALAAGDALLVEPGTTVALACPVAGARVVEVVVGDRAAE